MTEPALLEPPTVAPPRPALADLVLLRLLPAKKSVGSKDLREHLKVFFRRAPTADEVSAAVASLRAEGYVTAKGQQATDAGHARALQYLGIEKLPPRTDWRALKSKYLVPRALGLPPDAEAVRKGDKLAAFLLKRQLGLPEGTKNTLSGVFEAIACQVLGYGDHTTLKDLIPLLLAKRLGVETPIDLENATKVVPGALLDTNKKGFDGLRAVALGGWAEGVHPTPEREPEPVVDLPEEPFDLEAFANTVEAVARHCPTGRFGDNKVFINHVWQQLRDEPHFRLLGMDGFKAKLVEANRAERLTLGRADLVQLMDPADVQASEIAYLTATFHFIVINGD